jgi:hypothetical protein
MPLFEKGLSGNPGGRPKLRPLSKAYRDRLTEPFPRDPQGRTYAEVIAHAVIDGAVGGSLECAKEAADRSEGKATQALEVYAPADALTPEQRDARLRELAQKILDVEPEETVN